MYKTTLWGIVLIVSLRIEAVEFIGGEVTGVLEAGDYIVTETVVVPKSKKLLVSAGVKLYFEQFSGIKVSGEICCNGTADRPILFTSKKEFPDSANKPIPEPFDWNGIEINSDASGANFSHIYIRYCTFGVQVRDYETGINMQNIVFSDIGYTSITRNAKLVEVQQNIPFNISWNMIQPEIKTPYLEDDSKEFEKRKSKSSKLALQFGSGGVTLCGGIVLICSSIMASKNRDLYNSQDNPDGASNYRKAFNRSRCWQYTGGALLALGSISAGLTIFF